MRGLFIVGCKLLGIYIFHWLVLSLPNLFFVGPGWESVRLHNVLYSATYVIFCALLQLRTEWFAKIARIDSDPTGLAKVRFT